MITGIFAFKNCNQGSFFSFFSFYSLSLDLIQKPILCIFLNCSVSLKPRKSCVQYFIMGLDSASEVGRPTS